MEKNERLPPSSHHLSGSPPRTGTKSDNDQSTCAASMSQSSSPSNDILVKGFKKLLQMSGAKDEKYISKKNLPGKSENLSPSSQHLLGSSSTNLTKSDNSTDKSTMTIAASISQSSSPSEDILVPG